jgi:diadenosine tetraphosphate (Ap4A) HIT family hydrolase
MSPGWYAVVEISSARREELGLEERYERYHPDMEAMHHGFQTQPCFVCTMVEGNVRFPENIIYEDDRALVFLDGYSRAYGYTLVASKEHREQVTGDFTMEEYLELQRLIYRVTEAVREEVGAERMYLYKFGSNQGNSHVHWHVVPLPRGVRYEEQQGAWTSWSKGVLRIPQEEMASLAERIGRRVERIYPA